MNGRERVASVLAFAASSIIAGANLPRRRRPPSATWEPIPASASTQAYAFSYAGEP